MYPSRTPSLPTIIEVVPKIKQWRKEEKKGNYASKSQEKINDFLLILVQKS